MLPNVIPLLAGLTRLVNGALGAAVLSAVASAQLPGTATLGNGDFEQAAWTPAPGPTSTWTTANMPPEWNFCWWNHTAGTDVRVEPVTAPIATSSDVYSGTRACKLDLVVAPASGYMEFGKAWSSSTAGQYPVNAVLEGTLRVKLSRAALATSSRVAAYEFNPNAGGSPWYYGVKDLTFLQPTTDWQDVHVSHVIQHVASPAAPVQVRFVLELSGAQSGDSVLVDYAVFGGSDKLFHAVGSVPTIPDHEVRSSALSLLVEGATGRLLHLRSTENAAQSGLGRDLINSDPAAELSELFVLSGPVIGQYACSANPPDSIDVTDDGIVVRKLDLGWGLDIGVAVRGSDDSPDIEVQLYLKRQGTTPTELEELTCPVLRTPTTLGTADDDDRYLLGKYDGQLITPALQPGTSSTQTATYPGSASMQLLSFYDAQGGIAMYAADPTVEPKLLSVTSRRSGAASTLEIRHRIPITPGDVPSYPIVLAPTGGDWTSAASIYREWGLAQAWAQERPDWLAAPDWLAERPALFDATMQPEGIGIPLVSLQPSSTWASVLDAWRVELGTDMLPMYRTFEAQGIYATGPLMTPLRVHSTTWDATNAEYTTLYTESEIVDAWKDVVNAGHVNSVMFAGLKWARTRTQHPNQALSLPICPTNTSYWVPALDAANSGWAGAAGAPPGDEVCMKIDLPPAPLSTEIVPTLNWDTHHSQMCPWHDYTKDFHASMAAYLAADHVDCLQLDQFNTGKFVGCYNSAHGHPLGAGGWFFDEIAEVLDAMQAAGREANPRFMLSMEHPGEYYMPWIPAFFTRPHRLYPFGTAYRHVQVVPAFQFVYSSVSGTLTGSIDMFTAATPHSSNAQRPWPGVQIARAFVAGAMPWVGAYHFMLVGDSGFGCGTTSDPAGLLEARPTKIDGAHRALMRNTTRTGVGPAREFFNSGKMLTTAGGVSAPYTFQWPETFQTLHPATVPEVIHSAWLSADGTRIGIGFVNERDGAGVAFLPPTEIDGKPIPGNLSADVWVNGSFIVQVPWSALATTLNLNAGDVAWIEMPSF